jgi:hypothetical protein
MKHLTITLALAFAALVGFAQTTKKDTTAAYYKFTESQIIQISQLLSFGEIAAGNSDRISTKEYNGYHAAVLHIDSVLRSQYMKLHPAKEQPKKP